MGRRLIEIDGTPRTLAAHTRKFGIKYSTVTRRIAAGWSVERALKTPPRPPAAVEHEGEALTVDEVMRRTGASRTVAYERMKTADPLRPKQEPAKHPYGEEMLTVREIALREGVTRQAVADRTKPSRSGSTRRRGRPPKTIALDGIEATVAEHAARTGASAVSIRNWAKTTGRSGIARGPRTKGAKYE